MNRELLNVFRGISIAYCPRAWDLMFDAISSQTIRLEYGHSHLSCLLIDYVEIIYKYRSKIFHVHAKDAELLKRNKWSIPDYYTAILQPQY